jgi:hypothetical protein
LFENPKLLFWLEQNKLFPFLVQSLKRNNLF